VLFSIIETAKANGLTPFDYVMGSVEQTAAQNTDVEQLLPW
jgi:transposase